MKRRSFLKYTGRVAAAAPILVNGIPVSALPSSALFANATENEDRVLVLIQLTGGNDGLNTIIPLDQYDKLANARPHVLIPESSILTVEDNIGFHPTMTGMKSLYEDAKLGVIRAVGYPNQNRSHFRSTDIWTSGSGSEGIVTTGWLGRNFERNHAAFPENYPNGDYPDPFAVTMGSSVSETCQGTAANFSIAVSDPFNISALPEGAGSVPPMTPYGNELTYLRTVISQANAYGETVSAAAASGTNSAEYPDTNLAQQLKNVALLISGGSKTRVYICNLGGFDTHANQVVEGNPTNGEHAVLLQTLSDAVSAFQADLSAQGLEEKVLGMTFSEFGRRIISNESYGTDHGSAAPLIVFGSCVNPGFLGENPEIPDSVGIQDGVAMQYDFRDVYGSVLQDWFEVPEEDIQSILKPDYQHLPIVQACDTSTSTDFIQNIDIQVSNFPNPFSGATQIEFEHPGGHARLAVYNMLGSELAVLCNKTLQPGVHRLTWNSERLPAGNYFYRLQIENYGQKTGYMVKV